MKGKDVLILGGIGFIAYQFLKSQSQEEDGGGISDLLSGLGIGGGSVMPDLTGLFSGIGDLISNIGGGGQGGGIGDIGGGLNDMFAGLGNMLSGITGGITGGLGGGGDIVGEGGLRGLISETGGQTTGIIKAATGLVSEPFLAAGTGVQKAGLGAIDIGKAAAILGGTYLGVKTLAPIAPKIGQAFAATVKTPIGKSTILNAGGGFLNLLKSPITKVSPLTTVSLAAGAGYGGYKLGEVLMNKTPLGKWTGTLAENAAVNVFKTPVIGQLLFPHAEVKESKLKGRTVKQLQAQIAEKRKPKVTAKPDYSKQFANIRETQATIKKYAGNNLMAGWQGF